VTTGSEIEVIDKNMHKCAITSVDKNTGEPMDLFLLNGKGKCQIESMATGGRDIGSNGQVIVAGGYHAAGGEITVETTAECIPVSDTSASTSCLSGRTTIEAHEQANTAFVFLMDPEALSVRWLIQPWLALIDADYGIDETGSLDSYDASVTDSSLDADGDVYISGYRVVHATNPRKYAMISKHSGVDGSLLWEREFLDTRGLRFFHEREELYITFQMERSTPGISVLGITCSPTTSSEICNVIARISSENGSLHWARYTHGLPQVDEHGEIKLAHPDDGPYVYVTYSNGVGTSYLDLDVGTSYSGCRTNEGNITSEIDPVFSNLKIALNPTACREYKRGVYFNRTSDYALPAPFANTRAQCRWNHSLQHCLVKYHKLSGLPIWGSVTAPIQDFQPVADGIIMLGSTYGTATFDTVTLPWPDSLENGRSSVVYQSKIDLDGEGVYVQPIIAYQSSTTAAGVSQDPDTGDIYIGLFTHASKINLGPGAPVGFVQDLRLKDMGVSVEIFDIEASRVVIAKLGVDEMPYCIDSCGDSGTVIKKGMCFIDQVCYMKMDTGVEIGMPCHVCNPSISQTKWIDEDSFCFIDDICYKDGTHFTVEGIESECQTCNSLLNSFLWSTDPGYIRNREEDPPNDCTTVTYPPSLSGVVERDDAPRTGLLIFSIVTLSVVFASAIICVVIVKHCYKKPKEDDRAEFVRVMEVDIS